MCGKYIYELNEDLYVNKYSNKEIEDIRVDLVNRLIEESKDGIRFCFECYFEKGGFKKVEEVAKRKEKEEELAEFKKKLEYYKSLI